MRRRLVWAALAVAATLCLSSCSDKLDGKVTAKEVDPGYTFVYMQPIYSTTCSGKPSVCTTRQTGLIPIVYYVPTCYSITVKGTTSGDTCVSEKRYEALSVGDSYVGADVDPKDRKVEKKRGDAS